jgi:hypothetical protein
MELQYAVAEGPETATVTGPEASGFSDALNVMYLEPGTPST